MKENNIQVKKILQTLAKKSFIELQPICDECVCEIIYNVIDVFTSAHFDVFQIEDHLYCLRISV